VELLLLRRLPQRLPLLLPVQHQPPPPPPQLLQLIP
jgi:hypothetical protein